jgi:hypothetical protein
VLRLLWGRNVGEAVDVSGILATVGGRGDGRIDLLVQVVGYTRDAVRE